MAQEKHTNPYAPEGNLLGIDFSALDGFPMDIDQFEVDKAYYEMVDKELRESNFSQAVLERRIDSLCQWFDKFMVLRHVQVVFPSRCGKGPGKIDTAAIFRRFHDEENASNPVDMAYLLIDVGALAARCYNAIRNDLPEIIEKEVQKRLAERRAPVVEEDEDELVERMIMALQMANPDVTEEAVWLFVEGLSGYRKTAPLCRYIDQQLVQSGLCSPQIAMSGHLCAVYAACSNCTGRDGNPLKPRSIQAALRRYFQNLSA